MINRRIIGRRGSWALLATGVSLLMACSSSTSSSTASAGSGSAPADSGNAAAATSYTITAAQDEQTAGQTSSAAFCGSKPITLGIEDGLGTNAWSQESMTA